MSNTAMGPGMISEIVMLRNAMQRLVTKRERQRQALAATEAEIMLYQHHIDTLEGKKTK